MSEKDKLDEMYNNEMNPHLIEKIKIAIKNLPKDIINDGAIEDILKKSIDIGDGMLGYSLKELSNLKCYSPRILNNRVAAIKKNKAEKEIDDMLGDSYSIAMEILENDPVYCPEEYRETLLVYINGIYKEKYYEYLEKLMLDYFIEKKLNLELSDGYSHSKLGMIKKYVKAKTYCSIHDFDGYEEYNNLINVKNGILDITDLDNIILLKHDPKYRMRVQIPVDYDPNAKCPLITKQVVFVVGEKFEPLYYQSIGDALQGNPTKYQKMLILIGTELTGKTTLLNIVRKELGAENVSGESLHDLQEDPHSVAELENKLANIYGDLPKRHLKEQDRIKVLIGEKYLSANRKYGKKFQFINHCKNLFSANKLSEVYEMGGDFLRRLNLVPCFNTIKERIPDYEDIICTEEELSGLLNLALNGLKELRGSNGYDSKFSENTEELWDVYSNPLIPFIEQYINYDSFEGINTEYEIEKEQLLYVYNEYIGRYSIPPLKAINVLTRRINSQKKYKIKPRDFRLKGTEYHTYTNIQFNEKAIEEFGEIINMEKNIGEKEIYTKQTRLVEGISQYRMDFNKKVDKLMNRLIEIFEENDWVKLKRKSVIQALELEDGINKDFIINYIDELIESNHIINKRNIADLIEI